MEWLFWYHMGMKKETLRELALSAPLGSTDGTPEPKKRVLFSAWTPKMPGWRWTAYEGEETEMDDVLFFGRVDGWESELGYFSLDELISVECNFILTAEGPEGETAEEFVERVDGLARQGYYD